MNQNNSGFLKVFGGENITHTILVALLVLMPLFFIPSLFVTATIAKSVFVSISVLLALTSYVVMLVRRGVFSVPNNPVVFGSLVLFVAYLISSIFSTSSTASFWGYGFEIGTLKAVVLGLILTHLVSVSFSDARKVFIAHIGFLSVSLFLVLFQIVLMLTGGNVYAGGGFLSFVLNTVGKTNELALFFGVSGLVSLIALETVRLNKLYRMVLYTISVSSFVVIATVNFLTVWCIFAAVLFLFFLYRVVFLNAQSKLAVVSSSPESASEDEALDSGTRLHSSRKKIPVRTLVFLAISLLFIVPSFFGFNVAQGLSQRIGFNSLEVRPSWESTGQILKHTIAESTLTGAGPNRFSAQWQLFRPDINMTDFWNVDFDFGIGFIPTAFVETGIVGIIGWSVFLLSILFVGFRALRARIADQTTQYLVVSSLFATLFLWLVTIFYTPTAVLFGLAFFFTGLFVASAALAGVGSRVTVSLVGKKKTTFVAMALCVCVLVANIALVYMLVQSARASTYFQKANVAISAEGNIEKAEGFVFKAVDVAPNDIYYRMIANLSMTRINNLLTASAGEAEVTDAEKAQFQASLQNAIQAAQFANEFDALSFQNKAIAGQVYETIIPVQIDGAYEMSKKLYEESIVLSPRNPALFLAMARVEASHGDVAKAEEYIKKALELKWNYPDAIFLQSQIDISKGNVPSAIKSVQQIAALTPNDPLIFFRLGLLYYDVKNFTQAIASFEKSISLVPVYANAKYFLGLSYLKAGRIADSIKTFTELKATNPEASGLDSMIADIKAGKDPFADSSENVDPEKRKELPVKETVSSEKP